MTTTVAEPRTIDAGGIATSYLEAGSGEPVLMLHGSGPGVSATANWQYTIGPLSQRFHVLAPDIVGFGATERSEDVVYSLRTWTDHVWAFLDAHNITRTAIVGNSLGGRIALQMATDAPDRISRMVLMGSPGVGMTPTEGLAALRPASPTAPTRPTGRCSSTRGTKDPSSASPPRRFAPSRPRPCSCMGARTRSSRWRCR